MRWGWLCLGLAACGHHYTEAELFPDSQSFVGPTGGAGGEAGAGASSSSSGAGGGRECDGPADCPGVVGSCAWPRCQIGRCDMAILPAGYEILDQTPADCRTNYCDGAGQVVWQPNPTDLPADDGNPCTVVACNEGYPAHLPRHVGAECFGGMCDATHACVECLDGSRCQSGVCIAGACQPAMCTDGVRNGSEVATDCGGGTCPGCANGTACGADADCASHWCNAGLCSCGASHLIISEIQTRSPSNPRDEFIELYNPTDAAITVAPVTINRSGYTAFYSRDGITVAPGARFVIGGSAFAGRMDAILGYGGLFDLVDSGPMLLLSGNTLIDGICNCIPGNCAQVMGQYVCYGTVFHQTMEPSNVLYSLTRRPAGSECWDTDDASDFYENQSPTPGAP